MNTKRILASIGAGTLLFLTPLMALASPVIRSGDSVSIESDQVVESDFYGAGRSVILSGPVGGDAYLAGGSITVNAPVRTDLGAAGGTVQVHAPIADDVRIVGGDVTIADEVGGDVVVMGGVLRVLSTAHIKGDILFAGGELIIDGPVEGSVLAYGKNVRINASVGGTVNVTADQGLTLGDRAEVIGDITYTSTIPIVRAQNAVVVGHIQTHAPTQTAKTPADVYLVPTLSLLFGALVLLLIAKPKLQVLVDDTAHSYGMQGLIGLAVMLGLPFVGVILSISVLGFCVGIALLAGYIALISAAWLATAIVTGAFIMRLFTKSATVSFVSALVGVAGIAVMTFIPFIGFLLIFACFLIVLGGISKRLYKAVF